MDECVELSLINTFAVVLILLIYSGAAGWFWVVFTQQLDSKLNNAKSTCCIDFKFSGKIDFHKKNIHVHIGCKTPSMRKVISSCTTTY